MIKQLFDDFLKIYYVKTNTFNCFYYFCIVTKLITCFADITYVSRLKSKVRRT